jgi:Ankyrin repeat./PH domain.
MSSSQLNASLLRLKLLDALRSGEVAKVEAIISELSSTKSTIQNTDIIQLKETILHYTVQVAPLSIIQYLVSNSSKFGLDINSQDQDGNTPLHLTVLSSRIEVIKYLLSLPNINDTIVNLKKKQPVELCKDINIIQLMQFERAKFVETSSINLRKYFSTRDFKNLEKLLIVNARASELLDINGTDPTTGNTVLHEFIKKDDLEMCDWILKHGGDPFKRDKRGKLPIDLIQGKNDPLKKLLKLASKDQNIMDPVVNTSNAIKSGSIPTYKGYLRKWTNFAQGYKLRYFVLDQNGIFSYYTNQDDTNNACRGSLNLGFANLHLDSSEKLKFEIIGKNGMRWHLKANHSIETNRWVWTLQNAITLAKDSIKRKGTESREESKNKTKNIDDSKPAEPKTSSESNDEYKKHHLHIPGRRKHKRNTSTASLNSQSDFEDNPNTLSRSSTFSKQHNSTNLSQIKEKSLGFDKSNDDSFSFSQETDLDNDYDLDDDYESDDSTGESSDKTNTDEVSTVKRSLDVEILSLIDLFNQVVKDSQDKSAKELEICLVGISTLSVIQDLVLKYTNLVQTNDEKLAKKLDRQFEVTSSGRIPSDNWKMKLANVRRNL